MPASPSLGRGPGAVAVKAQALFSGRTGEGTAPGTRTLVGGTWTPGQQTSCSPEGLVLISTSAPLSRSFLGQPPRTGAL